VALVALVALVAPLLSETSCVTFPQVCHVAESVGDRLGISDRMVRIGPRMVGVGRSVADIGSRSVDREHLARGVVGVVPVARRSGDAGTETARWPRTAGRTCEASHALTSRPLIWSRPSHRTQNAEPRNRRKLSSHSDKLALGVVEL